MKFAKETVLATTDNAETESTTKELVFRGYVPGLDVLRGLAISGVLLYHGLDGRVPWVAFSGLKRWIVYASAWGSSGVELFFVLSGFLITGILLDNVTREDYYSRFYFNRVCRIVPAYLLILIVLKSTHIISWRYMLACLLYVANMAKLFGANTREYGAFWSLAVEEQFYLLWPVAIRRVSLRMLARLIPAYFVLAFLLRGTAAVFWPHIDFAYKLWGNADWLLSGALVAITLRSGQLHGKNIRPWMYGTLAAGLLLVPLVVFLDMTPSFTMWQRMLLMPLYRVPVVSIYVAMLLFVILRNRGKVSAAEQGGFARAFTFLGYISYGLYLVHPLIYQLLDRWTMHTWLGEYHADFGALLTLELLGVTVSIGIAYLSRRYFEEIFLRIKDHRARMKTRKSLQEALAEKEA